MFRSKNLMKSLQNHCSKNFRNKVRSTGKPVMISSASARSIYSSVGFLMKNKQIPITFVQEDGTARVAVAKVGDTILDVVHDNLNDIPSYGECGGGLACSTCHVIFKEEDFSKMDPPSNAEEDLICCAEGHCDTSRLGCQVQITENMTGLVLYLPAVSLDQRLSEGQKAPEEKNA